MTRDRINRLRAHIIALNIVRRIGLMLTNESPWRSSRKGKCIKISNADDTIYIHII